MELLGRKRFCQILLGSQLAGSASAGAIVMAAIGVGFRLDFSLEVAGRPSGDLMELLRGQDAAIGTGCPFLEGGTKGGIDRIPNSGLREPEGEGDPSDCPSSGTNHSQGRRLMKAPVIDHAGSMTGSGEKLREVPTANQLIIGIDEIVEEAMPDLDLRFEAAICVGGLHAIDYAPDPAKDARGKNALEGYSFSFAR